MSLLDQARAGLPLRTEIIDMHGHLGRYSFTIPDRSNHSVVASMDRLGIAKILCSHLLCMTRDVEYGNAQILEALREFPNRILGYVAVSPFEPDVVGKNVAQWLSAGFTGLKLHNANGFSYADSAYLPAYELANERRLPVLYHTWGNEKEFAEIRQVTATFPEMPILLAHSGSANETGYIEIAKNFPNIYLELALSSVPLGLVDRLVQAVGAGKIVWGSDVNFINQAHQVGKVIGAAISDAEKTQILGGNARKILSEIRQ
jgi:predicted TIM-barrel fold metal-dependent hydrolase